jgi:CHASE2 domain-containing sensor protein
MSYCINPWCFERQNPDELEFCQSCGTSLTINERYRILQPLRQLNSCHHTEIFEIDNLGTIKVLKVLTSDRQRLIQLFEQEARILKQLHHLGVPQVDTYFTFTLEDSGKELHCLVMEKIPGQNLAQWLKENGVLSEDLALDWLFQLTQFLQDLHQKEILHRDIKPSNIMLRPDGQLVLIDFGTARQITNTYIDKLEQGDLTRIYTSGYTAPEQIKGQAIYPSDFFALGRTFVHLLTGIHPEQLLKDPQTEALIWREQTSQISDSLANLIDELIALTPQQRLEQPYLILEKIKSQEELPISQLPSGGKTARFWQPRGISSLSITNAYSHLVKGLSLSIAIAMIIMGVRYLGWLQTFELQAFDRLLALRPIEQPDSRLLIVTIDESDIQYQNQRAMPMQGALSDAALLRLIEKLQKYQASTIGIDIYRDFPVNPQYPQLKTYLSSYPSLFAPCKVPSPQDGDPDGVAPPPEVPESRLGFSDFIADDHEIVRRHLLNFTPPVVSSCNTDLAFSLQIPLYYLRTQGIKPQATATGEIKIGKTLLQPLTSHTGGYQNLDASGYQIMLNYRSLNSPADIAQQISLRDALDPDFAAKLKELVKNRIVLVGVIAPSSADHWQTPWRESLPVNQSKIPGVIIQAHAISQIISAVLEGRSLIWSWSLGAELLWVWGWSGLGAILGLFVRRPLYLGIAIATALFLLFSICSGILIQGGWIPLISPALALIITSVVMVRLIRHSA